MNKLLLIFFILCSSITQASNNVRKINLAVDELAQVHTAVGIATIIQLPEPVQSVIIGDQGAFKIEYLDKAITIKPLRFGARTNLYVTTQSRRFNIRLTTLTQDASDYVVYIQAREKSQKSDIAWHPYRRVTKNKDYVLNSTRVGKTKDGYLLLDLTLKGFEDQKIVPEWFYIYQGKDSKTINSLFLSTIDLSKKSTVQVVLTLNQADLESDIPVRIEMHGKSTLKLDYTSGILWR